MAIPGTMATPTKFTSSQMDATKNSGVVQSPCTSKHVVTIFSASADIKFTISPVVRAARSRLDTVSDFSKMRAHRIVRRSIPVLYRTMKLCVCKIAWKKTARPKSTRAYTTPSTKVPSPLAYQRRSCCTTRGTASWPHLESKSTTPVHSTTRENVEKKARTMDGFGAFPCTSFPPAWTTENRRATSRAASRFSFSHASSKRSSSGSHLHSAGRLPRWASVRGIVLATLTRSSIQSHSSLLRKPALSKPLGSSFRVLSGSGECLVERIE
mmetsp:Transcript_42270/g.85535  ORF Transcript_42270/g.85535 Transcript_42270/m.85535 type:complete len:268 (-) Transcript_42270:247-1050(-)